MSRPIVFIYKDKPISFDELDYIIRGECVKYVKSPGVEIPFDIVDQIVRYITKGSTFKVILQSCKRLYELNRYKLPNYCNHLWTLIEAKIPRKNLDWCEITRNLNTSLTRIYDFAKEYTKNNKNVKQCAIKLVIDNLCQNPNITINEVKTLLPKLTNTHANYWFFLSCNPGITMQDIEDNLNLPWEWGGVSLNLNVTIDFVLKHIDKNWNTHYLSSIVSITEKDVERTLNIIKWDTVHLAYNENITKEFMKKHFPDYIGGFNSYSYFKICTAKQIDDYLQKEEVLGTQIMCNISINKNITIDLVIKYIHLGWVWGLLSSNSGIKLSDIDNHPELPWDWYSVSMNPNLTAQYVINNLSKKWDWYMIMCNNFNGDVHRKTIFFV